MVDLLKTFLSREMKIKIEEHLIKMKSTKFLSELNLDLNSNISLKSYSINDLEHDKFIWLEVANLSVYLYIEYEFFRQFYFPNRYESQIYEDRLKKLGYKQNNGIWKIDRIPNKQCIIENIFYSYIYMFLFKEKKIELDNENTSCVTDSLLMGNVAQHENLSENTVILYRNLTEMIDMEIQTESENIQQKGKKIQVGQTQLYGIVNSSCQIECRNRMLNKILQVGSPRLDYDWEVACQTGQIVKENQSQTDQFQYGNSLDGKLMKNKKLQVGNPQIDNRVEVECQVESTMCDVETETFLKYNNRIKTTEEKNIQVGTPRLVGNVDVECQSGQIVKEDLSQTDQFQYGNSLDGKLMKGKKLQVGNPQIDNPIEVECQVESTMCDVETETFLNYNNRIKTTEEKNIQVGYPRLVGNVDVCLQSGYILFGTESQTELDYVDKIGMEIQSENTDLYLIKPPSEGKKVQVGYPKLSKSKIKSNPSSSSQWTCNMCSYNKNNISKINCEVCMSSKFAKINSCVFESSSEASNENRIEHDANNADNKDKWTCIKCTFNNKISVDLCEICLAQNLNKIGTINDNELPEETWCCKGCGENNLFECYKCKNCRVPAEFFDKWRCEQCSYYNDKVAKHCGACEIENPYLMKCNLCVQNLFNKKYDKICKECTILPEFCTNNDTDDYQNNRETQSTTSEFLNSLSRISNKSLFKGDRNSGKLIENQMISNEDVQQNLGNKKNKMNSKPCKNCKSKECANNQYWCAKCEKSQWYCRNKACDGINFQKENCKQCKAKKGSDFSNCNKFWIIKNKKFRCGSASFVYNLLLDI